MPQNFNGWQARVSIQNETLPDYSHTSFPVTVDSTEITVDSDAFTADVEATYLAFNLVGRVSLSQSVEFVNKTRTVNLWRAEDTNIYAGKFYTGTIEVELGLNEVLRLLLLGFFEVESSELVSGGGGLYEYTLRPGRIQPVKSFKLAVEFVEKVSNPEGVVFSGLVIDQLAFDIRRNQVPKLQIQFKAKARNNAVIPVYDEIEAVTKRPVHHTAALVEMDSQALNLTEVNLTFTQRKQPERFKTDKTPGRFASGPFFMQGQLAEYLGPASVLSSVILDQNEHGLFFRLNDPAGTIRKLEVYWPAINFNEALPPLVSREEMACRASFNGLQSPDFGDAGPKLILIA